MTHPHFDIHVIDGLGRQQVLAVMTAVVILAAAAASFAQPLPAETPAVQQFTAATRAYAALHRRIENTLEPVEVTSNTETIQRLVQEMAAAIRAERPEARQGEFFTDALAVELRLRIAAALAANGVSAWDVHAAEAADGVDSWMVPLTVNGRFPWSSASAMFLCVREALPELPPELQYRIVGSTLVLVDVHAGLILDLLPQALPDTEL